MNAFEFIDIPLYTKYDSVQRQIGSFYNNSTFHEFFIKIIIFTISIAVGSFNFYQKYSQVIHYIMLLLLLNINF